MGEQNPTIDAATALENIRSRVEKEITEPKSRREALVIVSTLWGQLIASAIQDSGLGVKEAALKIGVSSDTYAKWRDAKAEPMGDSISKLSDYWKIHVEQGKKARILADAISQCVFSNERK